MTAGTIGYATRYVQTLAVLFDRDGTIIIDVPFNADPSRVVAMPHARSAFERLQRANLRTAVVSNQAGIAAGTLTLRDVDAVNARMQELLGPVGPIFVCGHDEDARCDCRKPKPGLLVRAADALGVRPEDCVMVGDIGSDMEAATAAGARCILVPTDRTRAEEIAAAPATASDLDKAVDAILAGAI